MTQGCIKHPNPRNNKKAGQIKTLSTGNRKYITIRPGLIKGKPTKGDTGQPEGIGATQWNPTGLHQK